MKKTSKAPKSKKNNLPPEVNAETSRMILNGFTEQVLGFNPGTWGTQLNQVTTMFKNNRWYLVSNMRQLLSQIYCEHGLVQTLVDVPVDDGLRGGVIIKTEELSEDEIEQIRVEMEQEGDIETVGQSLKWNQLFGGAGIVIITGQNNKTPFRIESLKPDSPLSFRAVDMWELFSSKMNTSDYAAEIDGPDLNEVEFYDYYGQVLHNTRVMPMKGMIAPSFIRPRLRGWGISICEALVNSINQYYKANNLIFEVLDEFKVDVYKIKNMTDIMDSPKGYEAVLKRVQMANQQKNFQNAIAMDSEDDFSQKELQFTGIAETMVGIRMQIASDMRMPLTKVFGISAAGFSSGEDDIENYNSMVESSVRAKSKFDIIKIIKLRCQRKFGYVPEDLTVEFKPLRVLTSEQEENVKNAQFNRLLQAMNGGHIDEKSFKEAINKNNLLPVQLDVNMDRLEPITQGDDSTDDGGGPESTKTSPEAPV